MNETIKDAIENYRDTQEENREARERLINLAIELGYDEKAINNDPRVARAYLEGISRKRPQI